MDTSIDQQLANLMGWKWIDRLHVKDEHGEYIVDGTHWQPTKDIEQAFMCVEKIRKASIFDYFGLTLYPSKRWDASLYYHGKERKRGDADTPEMAICDAIIAAVEGNK